MFETRFQQRPPCPADYVSLCTLKLQLRFFSYLSFSWAFWLTPLDFPRINAFPWGEMSNGQREGWRATCTYVGPSHRPFEYLSGWQVAFTSGLVFFLIVHEPVGLAPFDKLAGVIMNYSC